MNRKTKKYDIERTEEQKIIEIKDSIRKKIGKEIIKIIPKTENQKRLIDSIMNKNIMYVIGTGISGCGKTFISLVQAINLLLSYDNIYTKIRIFKSKQQLLNEDIGILPGGVEEKMEYMLLSYFIPLQKLLPPMSLEILFKEKIIEIIPMGNLRGLSLDGINIFDEFQNVSIDNTETVLTRLEDNGKMIIVGDIRQRDYKDKHDNGLLYLTENFKEFDDKFSVIEFCDDDFVRNPLIKKITEVFDNRRK